MAVVVNNKEMLIAFSIDQMFTTFLKVCIYTPRLECSLVYLARLHNQCVNKLQSPHDESERKRERETCTHARAHAHAQDRDRERHRGTQRETQSHRERDKTCLYCLSEFFFLLGWAVLLNMKRMRALSENV